MYVVYVCVRVFVWVNAIACNAIAVRPGSSMKSFAYCSLVWATIKKKMVVYVRMLQGHKICTHITAILINVSRNLEFG